MEWKMQTNLLQNWYFFQQSDKNAAQSVRHIASLFELAQQTSLSGLVPHRIRASSLNFSLAYYVQLHIREFACTSTNSPVHDKKEKVLRLWQGWLRGLPWNEHDSSRLLLLFNGLNGWNIRERETIPRWNQARNTYLIHLFIIKSLSVELYFYYYETVVL